MRSGTVRIFSLNTSPVEYHGASPSAPFGATRDKSWAGRPFNNPNFGRSVSLEAICDSKCEVGLFEFLVLTLRPWNTTVLPLPPLSVLRGTSRGQAALLTILTSGEVCPSKQFAIANAKWDCSNF